MYPESVSTGGLPDNPVIVNYLLLAKQAKEESDIVKFYSALSFAIYHMREKSCSAQYIRGTNVKTLLELEGKKDMERVVIEDSGSGMILSLVGNESELL